MIDRYEWDVSVDELEKESRAVDDDLSLESSWQSRTTRGKQEVNYLSPLARPHRHCLSSFTFVTIDFDIAKYMTNFDR